MDPKAIDELLARTLEDHRLSRAEKQELGQYLAELGADEQRAAFCRSRAFESARRALGDPGDRPVLDWLEEVVKALTPRPDPGPAGAGVEALFSPQDDCSRRIVQLLAQAGRAVDICVFTITDDRISDAILQAHRRGVGLRILTDNEKAFDEGSDVPRFREAGIPVRQDRDEYHMHHKFAVFDSALLLTGSYNWTRSASRFNQENFLTTGDRRLISAFSAAFERLWKRLE
jgi:mitochondrial cardiolipin hydrolase